MTTPSPVLRGRSRARVCTLGGPLALLALTAVSACDRTALVGADAITMAITGAGGSGGGGTTGAAGMPMPPGGCPTLSTVAGTPNHCGRTDAVAYSPDGRMLAAG